VTTVTATDADLPAQGLTYSISGGVDAAQFTINATTGVLSFSAAPNYESPTDSGGNNVYDVIVQVSDGTLADTQAIAVTVTNVFEGGIIVSAINGNTTEGAGTATFTVVLTEAPTADVTINLSSSDLAEGTVSVASVTFTAANWNTAQIVTVTGVDDDLDDGDGLHHRHSCRYDADGNYSGCAADVAVTNADDDLVGPPIANHGGGDSEPDSQGDGNSDPPPDDDFFDEPNDRDPRDNNELDPQPPARDDRERRSERRESVTSNRPPVEPVEISAAGGGTQFVAYYQLPGTQTLRVARQAGLGTASSLAGVNPVVATLDLASLGTQLDSFRDSIDERQAMAHLVAGTASTLFGGLLLGLC
jgi:hypothetical protein